MNEIINKGLMKEESLSARIYFLLLDEPLTQTEISKELYLGKVQLSNIKKNLDDLEKENYVKKIGREIGEGKNYNKIYYQSTLKPIIDFIKVQTAFRSKTSKSKRKEKINNSEIRFLEDFLISNWFKRFYSQHYLNLDLECEGKINKRSCSCPIRFFARLLEEIFVITENFGIYNYSLNKDYLDIKNFDEFIQLNRDNVPSSYKDLVERVIKIAKEVLGNYDETNKILDFYFKDYGVLFLPYSLSKKLSTLGRIPLTVSNVFNYALEQHST